MKKALLIGLKDLKIAARDRAALILMLAAPLVLTLGLGLVTGSFSGDSDTAIQEIPLVVVDRDGGQMGRALVDLFTSDDLQMLLEPRLQNDAAQARTAVDEDYVAAAVIIPATFTESIIPGADGALADPAAVEIYANPARPISSDVVHAIVQQFLNRVETGTVAANVAVGQLLQNDLITPQEAPAVGRDLGAQFAAAEDGPMVTLDVQTIGAEEEQETGFDALALLAPAMAIFFLMYTVTYGGRSLLEERSDWTLQRLLTTATAMAAVLGGKVIGIFLTGFAQLLILIFGTTLLFGFDWGNPLAVLLLIVATVVGATGWGLLLAAVARTPGQVSSVGTALMLLFGILGGSFIPAANFPAALQSLRLITPNAWAIDALSELAVGGGLADIANALVALLVMALVLGLVAVFLFRQRQVRV